MKRYKGIIPATATVIAAAILPIAGGCISAINRYSEPQQITAAKARETAGIVQDNRHFLEQLPVYQDLDRKEALKLVQEQDIAKSQKNASAPNHTIPLEDMVSHIMPGSGVYHFTLKDMKARSVHNAQYCIDFSKEEGKKGFMVFSERLKHGVIDAPNGCPTIDTDKIHSVKLTDIYHDFGFPPIRVGVAYNKSFPVIDVHVMYSVDKFDRKVQMVAVDVDYDTMKRENPTNRKMEIHYNDEALYQHFTKRTGWEPREEFIQFLEHIRPTGRVLAQPLALAEKVYVESNPESKSDVVEFGEARAVCLVPERYDTKAGRMVTSDDYKNQPLATVLTGLMAKGRQGLAFTNYAIMPYGKSSVEGIVFIGTPQDSDCLTQPFMPKKSINSDKETPTRALLTAIRYEHE